MGPQTTHIFDDTWESWCAKRAKPIRYDVISPGPKFLEDIKEPVLPIDLAPDTPFITGRNFQVHAISNLQEFEYACKELPDHWSFAGARPDKLVELWVYRILRKGLANEPMSAPGARWAAGPLGFDEVLNFYKEYGKGFKLAEERVFGHGDPPHHVLRRGDGTVKHALTKQNDATEDTVSSKSDSTESDVDPNDVRFSPKARNTLWDSDTSDEEGEGKGNRREKSNSSIAAANTGSDPALELRRAQAAVKLASKHGRAPKALSQEGMKALKDEIIDIYRVAYKQGGGEQKIESIQGLLETEWVGFEPFLLYFVRQNYPDAASGVMVARNGAISTLSLSSRRKAVEEMTSAVDAAEETLNLAARAAKGEGRA